jgi:hypothetical protein
MNDSRPSAPPDFRLRTSGLRVLLAPLTPRAGRWLDTRLAHSDDLRWSDGALVLDAAGAPAFVEALRREGMEVRP